MNIYIYIYIYIKKILFKIVFESLMYFFIYNLKIKNIVDFRLFIKEF